MAHYAELDGNNRVVRVIVIPNDQEPTEEAGIEYCRRVVGGKNWKKTSYNKTIRKNFASPGYSYDPRRDAFIPPRPFPSWQFVEETCSWRAPVECPRDGKLWYWDEKTTSWIPSRP